MRKFGLLLILVGLAAWTGGFGLLPLLGWMLGAIAALASGALVDVAIVGWVVLCVVSPSVRALTFGLIKGLLYVVFGVFIVLALFGGGHDDDAVLGAALVD